MIIGGYLTVDIQVNPVRGGQPSFNLGDFDKALSNAVDDLDTFLKIPFSLLRFQIYAENPSFIESGNKRIAIIMAIDVDSQYQEVTTGNKKPFNYFLKSPADLENVPVSISFKVNTVLPEEVKIGGANPKYGLRPTLLSFFIVFFASITLVYTFYFVVMKWYRFIIYSRI